MLPVVTPTQMAAIDAAAPEPVDVLIQRAGRAVARQALGMLGGAYGRRVVVLAGRGNNGADGLVAGDRLAARGVQVRTFALDALPARLPACDLVIDAVFGTGYRVDGGRAPFSAPEAGEAAVLAVDIPSGVDALTGAASPGAYVADRTVTFQALKPGQLIGSGARHCGELAVVDIGLDVTGADTHLVERRDVDRWWPRRRPDAHKWVGATRIVAGSHGMLGAARLSAAAAARAGSGLVSLSSPGADPDARSEIIQHELPPAGWAADVLTDIERFAALVCGPGLGLGTENATSIRELAAAAPIPLVLDGDGLSAVADDLSVVADRAAPTVLTPHDGEYRRLCGAPPEADRVAAARALAERADAVVLLKGPTTVVAEPTGRVLLVDHGDERLATAGSGDVLTGIIAAAVAGGCPPLEAAAAGAWVHAEAARCGPPTGLLAGDLPDLLVDALP
ncbi:MAG: NAD(P)H-hydrate dehydratase [Actinomycetota bacterium]